MKRRIASDEELPQEKWLVAFRNQGGSVFVRQFLAPGYYEAYDVVMSHAEKMHLEVLWFLEKRKSGQYMNTNYPELGGKCVWCNRKFGSEPVPCSNEDCEFEFCSRKCMFEHVHNKH